ncbi:hypothetical protein FQZ97_1042560 [compost metagenome]
MLEGTRNHVGAAADHRLQRLGAASEVDDGHVQALVLEVAQLLRHRQGQVVEEVLAPYGDGELGLFDGLRETEGGQGGCGQAASNELSSLHGMFSG